MGIGSALICAMGDGIIARKSDVTEAFDLWERAYEHAGRTHIVGTSCRTVSFEAEPARNGLSILKKELPVLSRIFS